jgi:hypothetical protein
MRKTIRSVVASVVVLFAVLVGCEDVARPNGIRASWRYVEDGWGGLAAGEPRIAGNSVTLPLKLGVHPTKRVDSVICIASLSASVKRARIVVHLHKGICGNGSVTVYEATFPRPAAGTYPVVYDDLRAGFPKIGEVRIP